MSAGFTLGPWEAFHRPGGIGITGDAAADFVIPAGLSAEERACVADYAVARCLTSLNGFDPIAERQANANLIAAAPALYAELESAALVFRMLSEVAEEVRLEGAPELLASAERAEAILAKARGELLSDDLGGREL